MKDKLQIDSADLQAGLSRCLRLTSSPGIVSCDTVIKDIVINGKAFQVQVRVTSNPDKMYPIESAGIDQ